MVFLIPLIFATAACAMAVCLRDDIDAINMCLIYAIIALASCWVIIS